MVFMKKMGAPKKEIDQKVFEGLCGLQCTLKEVCEFFHVSKPTLERWCKDAYGETFFTIFGKKRGSGIISLRRNMFKLSESSAAMCIFMAKNWLGMKDNPVDEDDKAVAQPVTVTIQVQDASNKNKSE